MPHVKKPRQIFRVPLLVFLGVYTFSGGVFQFMVGVALTYLFWKYSWNKCVDKQYHFWRN